MTSNEQAILVLEIVDKELSYSAPHISDIELSNLLTVSQDEFVKSKYTKLGNKYQQGFENTEKRRKDLAQLVKGATISYDNNTNQYSILYQDGTTETIDDTNLFFHNSIVKPNGSLWKLPQDSLWVINEEITWNTNDPCYQDLRIEVKPITHDEYNKNVRNTFKKPYEELVWRLDYSREFNNNEVNYVNNPSSTWYRITLPATVDNSTPYTLTINDVFYGVTTDSSATQTELYNLFIASFNTNGVTYYGIGGTSVIYIASTTAITTNDDITTEDIIIEDTNVVMPNTTVFNNDHNVHELITNGWIIENYYIRYIRRPNRITVDFDTPTNQVHCELDEITHIEIAQIAARKLYTNLMDPRLQPQIMEQQKSE
jgi:hypothetical protein